MIDKLVLEALKEACIRAGNQLELAKQSGLSQGQISDYLCGRRQIKNMTLGTLEKLFPELMLTFFKDQNPSAVDPVELEIMQIVHSMNPTQKAYCLKIIAANFPDSIIKNMKHPLPED